MLVHFFRAAFPAIRFTPRRLAGDCGVSLLSGPLPIHIKFRRRNYWHAEFAKSLNDVAISFSIDTNSRKRQLAVAFREFKLATNESKAKEKILCIQRILREIKAATDQQKIHRENGSK
jgi:hypothetical protein